jgi:carbohydrate-binding DOMON domain-containing protein
MKTKPVLVFCLVFSLPAASADLTFADPEGDDNGPGGYLYPTAPEYKPGSFDLTRMELKDRGDKLDIVLHFKATIEDPWKSRDWPVKGNGFSLQMAFVFFDTDGKEGSGHTEGIPGLNVRFAPASAWEKAVIVSPQGNNRLKSEIQEKAKSLERDLIIPLKVKASGKKIIATVSKKDLGQPAAGWGYQVLVQSNEGYPDKTDLLTRKVNQARGEHRFGGGRDDDCDPHVIDLLAGEAKGDKSEIELQHKMLGNFACEKPAEITMVKR